MFRVTKYARSPEGKSERTTQQKRHQHCGRRLVVVEIQIYFSKNYILDVNCQLLFFRFSKRTEDKSRLVKLSVKIQHRKIRKQLFLVL